MDWEKTTVKWDEKHLSLEIWCTLYWRFDGNHYCEKEPVQPLLHSWCHDDVMMTSSNGNIFPSQRPVTWSFDVFFDLCPNKHLGKVPWGWWIEVPSRSLWRHCNGFFYLHRGQWPLSSWLLMICYLCRLSSKTYWHDWMCWCHYTIAVFVVDTECIYLYKV